jgi:hypothetical protein
MSSVIEELRYLAADFRELAKQEVAADEGRRLVQHHREFELRERAGRVAEALLRDGTLDLPDGAKLLAWMRGAKHPGGKPDSFVRCPANLWGSLVGGGLVRVVNDARPPRIVEEVADGALVKLRPQLFSPEGYAPLMQGGADMDALRAAQRRADLERSARGCGLLAELAAKPAQGAGAAGSRRRGRLTKADHQASEAAMQELLSKHRSMVDDTDAVAAQCGVSAKTARRYIDTLRERHARGRHDRDE